MTAHEDDASQLIGMTLLKKSGQEWTSDWNYLLTSDRGITRLYFEPLVRHRITPFHMAIAKGCPIHVMREMIIKHPEIVHCVTDGGELPLHFAVASHHLKAVELLLSKDLRVATSLQHASRATGAFGNQVLPLHVAVATRAPEEIVSLLLKYCPPTAVLKDGNGKSPISIVKLNYEGPTFRNVTKALMKARWEQTRKNTTPSSHEGDSIVTTGSSSTDGDNRSFQQYWDTINWDAPDRSMRNLTFAARKKSRSSVVSEEKSQNDATAETEPEPASQTTDDEYTKISSRRSSMPLAESEGVATKYTSTRRSSAPTVPSPKPRRKEQSLDELFKQGRKANATRQSRQSLDELSRDGSKISRCQSVEGPLKERMDKSVSSKLSRTRRKNSRRSSEEHCSAATLQDNSIDTNASRRKSESQKSFRQSRSKQPLSKQLSRRLTGNRDSLDIKRHNLKQQPDEDLSNKAKLHRNKGKLDILLGSTNPLAAIPFPKEDVSKSFGRSSNISRASSSSCTDQDKDSDSKKSILNSVRDQMLHEQNGSFDEANKWKEYRATKRDVTPESRPRRSRHGTLTSRSSSRSVNDDTTGGFTKSTSSLPKQVQTKTHDNLLDKLLEARMRELRLKMPEAKPFRARSKTAPLQRMLDLATQTVFDEQPIHLVEDKNMKFRRGNQRRQSSKARRSSEAGFVKLLGVLLPDPVTPPSHNRSGSGLRAKFRADEVRKDVALLQTQMYAESRGEKEQPIQDNALPVQSPYVALIASAPREPSKQRKSRKLEKASASDLGIKVSNRRLLWEEMNERSKRDSLDDSIQSKSSTQELNPPLSVNNAGNGKANQSKYESADQRCRSSSAYESAISSPGESPPSKTRSIPREAALLLGSLDNPTHSYGDIESSRGADYRTKAEVSEGVAATTEVSERQGKGEEGSEKERKPKKKKKKKKSRKSSRHVEARLEKGVAEEGEGENHKKPKRSRRSHKSTREGGDDETAKKSRRSRRSSTRDCEGDSEKRSIRSVKSKRSSKSCNSRQTETGDRSTNSSRAQFLAPESPNDVFFQHAQNDSILLSEMSGDEGDESEGGELTDYSSSTGMDSSYTDASVSSSSMSSYATNSSVGTSNSKQSKREKKLRYQGPPATSLLPPRDEASDDEDRPGYPMPYMMSAMRRAANVL